MHNRLNSWINGYARETIGGYWGRLGVCLVSRSQGLPPTVVYVPSGKDTESAGWGEAVLKLEALSGIKRAQMAFAMALDTDDVFLRTITVPEGLDERQLEQVAIVEAVSNLPVPPEEICLDFIRGSSDGRDETVGIAFCRRERIDEILANAEEVNVPVHVIDRDVQAIHDAIENKALSENTDIKYPYGIVLTELSSRIVICLGPTEFEVYPVRIPTDDIAELGVSLLTQLKHCWMRCKMSRPIDSEVLEQVLVIGDVAPRFDWQSMNAETSSSKKIDHLLIDQFVEKDSANDYAPDEIILIALGMSGRCLS